jgi:hypothetical protein
MIPEEKMIQIRQAITTALTHAVANRPEQLAEVLADTLGFMKAHHRGTKMRGVHEKTRQGFMVVGINASPTIDTTGIRVRERPRGIVAPARSPGGRCTAPKGFRDGREIRCGGGLMMVGDVAVCQLCRAEYPTRGPAPLPPRGPRPPTPPASPPAPAKACEPAGCPAFPSAREIAMGRPVDARPKAPPVPDPPLPPPPELDPAIGGFYRLPGDETRIVDTSTNQDGSGPWGDDPFPG